MPAAEAHASSVPRMSTRSCCRAENGDGPDWTATVEELPGCEAHGPTPERAAAAVSEAVERWVRQAEADGPRGPAAGRGGRAQRQAPRADAAQPARGAGAGVRARGYEPERLHRRGARGVDRMAQAGEPRRAPRPRDPRPRRCRARSSSTSWSCCSSRCHRHRAADRGVAKAKPPGCWSPGRCRYVRRDAQNPPAPALLALGPARLPARRRGGRSVRAARRQGVERPDRRLRRGRLPAPRGQAPRGLAALHRLGRPLPVHDRELPQRRRPADVPPEHVQGAEHARALQPRRDRPRQGRRLPRRPDARHRRGRRADLHAASRRDEQLQQPVRVAQLQRRPARRRPLGQDVHQGLEARLRDHARRRGRRDQRAARAPRPPASRPAPSRSRSRRSRSCGRR